MQTPIKIFQVSAARTPANTVFLDEAAKDDKAVNDDDKIKEDKAINDSGELEDEDSQMGVSIKCPK